MFDITNLPVYSFDIDFIASEKIKLPYFKGNLIRGLFGKSLKNIYCTNPLQRNCSKCAQNKICRFAEFFQSIIIDKSNLPEKYQKFSNFPSMFSIFPLIKDKKNYLPDEIISIQLNFIGDIEKYFNVIIQMLENVKSIKPDYKSNGRLLLESIRNFQDQKLIYKNTILYQEKIEKIQIEKSKKGIYQIDFLSPVRITSQGKYIMNSLTGEILTQKIIERSILLLTLYADVSDFPEISENAISILEKELHWKDLTHNSNRQHSKIKLGGFVGKIKIKINDEKIIPLLQLLSVMQIGSNVKAGYGKFVMKKIEK